MHVNVSANARAKHGNIAGCHRYRLPRMNRASSTGTRNRPQSYCRTGRPDQAFCLIATRRPTHAVQRAGQTRGSVCFGGGSGAASACFVLLVCLLTPRHVNKRVNGTYHIHGSVLPEACNRRKLTKFATTRRSFPLFRPSYHPGSTTQPRHDPRAPMVPFL